MEWLSFESVLLSGILVVFLLSCLQVNNHNQHWELRNVVNEKPPLLSGLLFGNFADAIFMKTSIGDVLYNMYKKYPTEKVVGFFYLRTPALLLRDPELVHKVLVTDFNSFRNHILQIDVKKEPLVGSVLQLKRDSAWKIHRNLLTPGFTTGKLRFLVPGMVSSAEDLVRHLSTSSGDVHVQNSMRMYVSEVVAKCLLGKEGDFCKKHTYKLYEMAKTHLVQGTVTGFKLYYFFIIPNILKYLRIRLFHKEINDYFEREVCDMISNRQEGSCGRHDLVQVMLNLKAKNGDQDIFLTKEQIASIALVTFFEFSDGASMILTNALFFLALYPKMQAKLQQEVDIAFKDAELTWNVYKGMNYLHCVILEAQRMFSPISMIQKECMERYEMDIGRAKPLVVEKGTRVVIPVGALHTDPAHWEHPQDFQPERFANNADVTAKAKGVFLPFSDGPRICVGMRLTLTVMKVALAHLVAHFEVVKSSSAPNNVDFDPTHFTLGHKSDVYLRFIHRGPRTPQGAL